MNLLQESFINFLFLKGEGVMEIRCKYLSFWNLLECNVTLWNSLEHSTERCNYDVMLLK